MFLKPININKIIVNQFLATKEILLRRESYLLAQMANEKDNIECELFNCLSFSH